MKRVSGFEDPAGGLTCPSSCEWFSLSNAKILLLINRPEPQPVPLPKGVSLLVGVMTGRTNHNGTGDLVLCINT